MATEKSTTTLVFKKPRGVEGLRPASKVTKENKVLVKDLIKVLQEFHSDQEEIIALWFTKEEFEGVDEGQEISDAVWLDVVAQADRLDLDAEIMETVQSLVWDHQAKAEKEDA